MTTGNTADRSIVSNAPAAAPTDNLQLDESTAPGGVGCPRFPLAVWIPPVVPVVMGAGGIWAKSLIEMMVAASNR